MGRTILDMTDDPELHKFLEGAILSGPHLLDANDGEFPPAWCIVAFSTGTRAHYFLGMKGVTFARPGLTVDAKPYGIDITALCGKWADPMALFEAGTFPRCKTCERILAARKEDR
jgi:hypothetical protein